MCTTGVVRAAWLFFGGDFRGFGSLGGGDFGAEFRGLFRLVERVVFFDEILAGVGQPAHFWIHLRGEDVVSSAGFGFGFGVAALAKKNPAELGVGDSGIDVGGGLGFGVQRNDLAEYFFGTGPVMLGDVNAA